MLNVLLISEQADQVSMVEQALAAMGCGIEKAPSGRVELSALLLAVRVDAVVFDLGMPQIALFHEIKSVNRFSPVPLVMFADDDKPTTIKEAIKAGVDAYVVDKGHSDRMGAILEIAIARFEARQGVVEELKAAQAKLEERKVVEKAKGILMRQHRLDESGAYHHLRKMAMDRKERMAVLANRLIEAEQLLS